MSCIAHSIFDMKQHVRFKQQLLSHKCLMVLSAFRCLAICQTLRVRKTTMHAWVTIVFIWLFAVAINAPLIVVHELQQWRDSSTYTCDAMWSVTLQRAFFVVVVIIISYTIPLSLISVCYALIGYRVWNRNAPGVSDSNPVIYKSKVKALKMLLVVVVLFTFSWLPLYAVNIRMQFQGHRITETEWYILSTFVVPISQWLGSSNSCVNPIIYCFYSKKFRNGFHKLVACCCKPQRSQRNLARNNSVVYFSVNNNASAVTNATAAPDVTLLKRNITRTHNGHVYARTELVSEL